MEASILLSRILRLSTLAGFCLSPADPPMTDQDCGRARRNFAGIPDAAARTPLLAIGAPCSAKQAAANLLINCSLDSEQASMPPWSATMALEMSRYLRAMVLRPSTLGSVFEPFGIRDRIPRGRGTTWPRSLGYSPISRLASMAALSVGRPMVVHLVRLRSASLSAA